MLEQQTDHDMNSWADVFYNKVENLCDHIFPWPDVSEIIRIFSVSLVSSGDSVLGVFEGEQMADSQLL